jgi:hypothetical protein
MEKTAKTMAELESDMNVACVCPTYYIVDRFRYHL